VLDDNVAIAELTAGMGSRLLRSQLAWKPDGTALRRGGCRPTPPRGGAACARRATGLA
jgi:hypothetical protein